MEITFFSEGTGRWVVSYGGGFEPRWSDSGDAIYYHTPGGMTSRASIDTRGETIRIGDTERLFRSPPIADFSDFSYDVAPGGERFLVNAMIPITVEVGWRE